MDAFKKQIKTQNYTENIDDDFVSAEYFCGWGSDDVSNAFWSYFSQYKETKNIHSRYMIHAAIDWAKENDRKLYRKLRRAWDQYFFGAGFYKETGKNPKDSWIAGLITIAIMVIVVVIAFVLST